MEFQYGGGQPQDGEAPQQQDYSQPQYTQPRYAQPQGGDAPQQQDGDRQQYAQQQRYTQPQYAQQQYAQPQYTYTGRTQAAEGDPDVYSMAAMVCGVLGLFIGLPAAIMAICLGRKGRRLHGTNSYNRAGEVMGWLSVALVVVAIVAFFGTFAVFIGQLSSMYPPTSIDFESMAALVR